jgi:hypothetical protein
MSLTMMAEIIMATSVGNAANLSKRVDKGGDMTTAQGIFLAMAGLVILGALARELLNRLLSKDGYEYATLVLVMAGLGVTIAGLDGIAHA